jgi:protein-arginine kinase activator protein McsA
LREALDAEDFETAAELRDELNRRQAPPPDDRPSRQR